MSLRETFWRYSGITDNCLWNVTFVFEVQVQSPVNGAAFSYLLEDLEWPLTIYSIN